MDNVTLTVTTNEFRAIMTLIAHGKYIEVQPLISKLNTQVSQQLAAARVEEGAPDEQPIDDSKKLATVEEPSDNGEEKSDEE